MPEQTPPGLDNSALRGRIRQPAQWQLSPRPALPPVPRRATYPASAARSVTAPPPTATPGLPATPPAPQQPPVAGPPRQYIHEPDNPRRQLLRSRHYSKLQVSLAGMAVVIFLVGLIVSLQTVQTNHTTAAQVSVLAKRQSGGGDTPPSTVKPSGTAISQYAVAPDLPRYLNISKLGVHARVLQVGVTGSGALGTPSNVYDTAWYTGSVKPGLPGAMLIDGHVSSWTTRGVFYGLKQLSAGDTLQIVRGDGAVFNYRVVKTQTYDANHVDMQAAITPVTAGKAGLNLITCTGQVQKGTSEFNQRLIVFAEQV